MEIRYLINCGYLYCTKTLVFLFLFFILYFIFVFIFCISEEPSNLSVSDTIWLHGVYHFKNFTLKFETSWGIHGMTSLWRHRWLHPCTYSARLGDMRIHCLSAIIEENQNSLGWLFSNFVVFDSSANYEQNFNFFSWLL